jgi:hypothetical protein
MCSPSQIQAFLPPLQKFSQLESLRINAQLAAEQTEMLVQLSGVKNLTLDFASWHVVDALPRWAAEKLAPTLTCLTIFVSNAHNSFVMLLLIILDDSRPERKCFEFDSLSSTSAAGSAHHFLCKDRPRICLQCDIVYPCPREFIVHYLGKYSVSPISRNFTSPLDR